MITKTIDGASKDYRFPQKENWRRWAWNRLEARSPVRPRDAVVLYLAGAHDLDREEALKRGFRAHNLIAIERELKACEALRAQGTLTIHGDFFDVVEAWPEHTLIDCLVGDFCSGLAQRTVFLVLQTLASRQVNSRAALLFNFLRGREAGNLSTLMGVSEKRRSHQLLHQIVWCMMPETMSCESSHAKAQVALNLLCSQARPEFNSYPSGSLWMDSICINSPAFISKQDLPNHSAALRRQISAVLAHRTMRHSK